MATPGKTVVLESGKRGLLNSGKGAVYNEQGRCPNCCRKINGKIRVLGSFVTNFQNPVWDLTPFQGEHMAMPDAYWRLIERGNCYPGEYPWYGAGCVDENGRLVGLSNHFLTGYAYDGFMELQIGSLNEDGTQIEWPGSCQTTSPVYPCSHE